MVDEKLMLVASDISISEKKQNDVFMYVEMRVASTRSNSNHEGVTSRFIDSVIDNQEVMYNCLPLYVDLCSLKGKRYRSLTHLFDKKTGRFGTTQIGSLCGFYKVEDEYGVSLMAEARIPKRDIDICRSILDLYALGCQNFSFEISYNPEDTIIEDGVRYVDASERNVLKGVAVVSVPAYRESVALSLVAEDNQMTEMEDDELDEEIKEENIDETMEPVVLIPVEEGVVVMTLEEALQALAEKDNEIAELKAALAEKVEEEKPETPDQIEEEKTDTDEEEKAIAEDLESEKAASAEKDIAIAEQLETIASQAETISALNEKIAEMEPMIAELEALKAEQARAEHEAKENRLKAFAEKARLDVTEETVANAIAELNYEALVEMASAVPEIKEEVPEISPAIAGDSLKVKNRFGNLLDRK